jgi:hypothetical protein
MSSQPKQELIEKLRALPPERLAEVEDFVDFLRVRDEERQLRQSMAQLSAESFAQVWDNADDDAYDRL